MIKRILALFIIALLLIPQATVYADVIFGNEFLFEHADKTQRITENEFIANGPNGYVSAKKNRVRMKKFICTKTARLLFYPAHIFTKGSIGVLGCIMVLRLGFDESGISRIFIIRF